MIGSSNPNVQNFSAGTTAPAVSTLLRSTGEIMCNSLRQQCPPGAVILSKTKPCNPATRDEVEGEAGERGPEIF